MINVDEALKKVLDDISLIKKEVISIEESLGRVLAEDVFAGFDIPEFSNSSMDGFAVISSNTSGAAKNSPIDFEIVDSIRAGITSDKTLKEKQTIRLMTGTIVPKDADAVVMVEDTEKEKDNKKDSEYIRILKEVKIGENIRKKGESVKKGDLVIEKGIVISPATIGMLASLGKAKVKVSRKPKIAILSTGDELVDLKGKVAKGKIRNSNVYSLSGLVKKHGGVPVDKGISKDNLKDLKIKIKKCLDCDIILTCGGVSAGDYDFVKTALEELGADIKFWKVAVKPGKPILFGKINGKPVFGLPGNVVSCMISFEVFVRPALSKMMGSKKITVDEVEALLEEDLTKDDERRTFFRAVTEWKCQQFFTKSTGPQGSGILDSMVKANSLLIFPEDKFLIKAGSKVKVRFL